MLITFNGNLSPLYLPTFVKILPRFHISRKYIYQLLASLKKLLLNTFNYSVFKVNIRVLGGFIVSFEQEFICFISAKFGQNAVMV